MTTLPPSHRRARSLAKRDQCVDETPGSLTRESSTTYAEYVYTVRTCSTYDPYVLLAAEHLMRMPRQPQESANAANKPLVTQCSTAGNMERANGFEPSTCTLARYRSTN